MNSKERFTNRVDSYVKYRPSYPVEVIDYLYSTIGLQASSLVADIGAGTGIFSKLLLERGSRVTALEPNQAMRDAAQREFGGNPNFTILPGSAEVTGLPDQSVDYIVCAQSFHWFDRAAAQAEFRRILKPGGKAVLLWNSRITHGTPFLEGYDHLLYTFGVDYHKVAETKGTLEKLTPFFKDGQIHEKRFSNRQIFDFEGLSGRLQSSSYAPVAGAANYDAMMQALKELFERSEQDGKVYFDYQTELFWGEV
ncbi:class I SAM-dependent methyltransferase [Paenibacillaceae bacterium]|nr:class I SAM-dependent methyltransferase [Paenibacillaceae bacterium]